LIGTGRHDRLDPSVAILIPPGKPECVALFRIKSGGLNRHRFFVKQHCAKRPIGARPSVRLAADNAQQQRIVRRSAAIQVIHHPQARQLKLRPSRASRRRRLRPLRKVRGLQCSHHQRVALTGLLEGEQQVVRAAADGSGGDPGLVRTGRRIETADLGPSRAGKHRAGNHRTDRLDSHRGGHRVLQPRPQLDKGGMQGELQQQGRHARANTLDHHPAVGLLDDSALIDSIRRRPALDGRMRIADGGRGRWRHGQTEISIFQIEIKAGTCVLEWRGDGRRTQALQRDRE